MRRALLGFLLLPALAWAQPTRHLDQDASLGVFLPPTSAALADEAPGMRVNPAGLSQLQAVELYYLHARSDAQNQSADGIFLGNRLFGVLGFGLGLEWIRPTDGDSALPSRRRTTWGLSLGDSKLSLGASLGLFGATDNAFLDRTRTWDLGVMSRPHRAISLGAVARNLGDPLERLEEGDPRDPLALPRTYALAAALRPFGERFSAGVEYEFSHRGGPSRGRLHYLAEAMVWRGVRLGAGFGHRVGGPAESALQLSLGVDLENVGVRYAQSLSDAGGAQLVQARLSTTAWQPVVRPRGRIALVDVAAILTGTDSPLSLLGPRQADGFTRLTRLLARAARDPSISGVLVKIESFPDLGLGRAEELRSALLSLREAGKRVVAVVFTAGDSEYLVASGAEQILALPQSMLMVNGIAANVTFFGTTMEKLGVKWDVAKVGAYKNAPDQLTRSQMTDEHRESIDAWLDSEIHHLHTTLAQMRGLEVAQIQAVMKEGMVTPARALELRLVDAVIDPARLEDWLKENLDGARLADSYSPFVPRRGEWGRRKRVVVIPVVGTIASGRSREDPLGMAQVAGAQTVVRALEQAAEDDAVAAIVVRVESGGGDALASDLMYRAVLEAKKKKPVVATMGDVAASGGYYAAMGANEVWASPTTLTGSIGVFMMKPAVAGLAEKLGVSHQTLKRGELSNMLSAFDSWDEQERAVAQKWVDAFYDDFITLVASSRKLEKGQVDQVARGRVWSGVDAHKVGLVDHLGSFLDALHSARRLGGISDDEAFEVEISGEPGGMFTNLGRLEAKTGLQLPQVPQPFPPGSAVQQLLQELGAPPSVLFEPGLKAMLPYNVRAR